MKYKLIFNKIKAKDDRADFKGQVREFLLKRGYKQKPEPNDYVNVFEKNVRDALIYPCWRIIVDYKNAETYKVFLDHSGSFDYALFKNAELKYFDDLDFKLYEPMEERLGQHIDDWFDKENKALDFKIDLSSKGRDDPNFIAIKKEVDEQMLKFGYKYIESRGAYLVMHYRKIENDAIEFLVWLSPHVIRKIDRERGYIEFTNEELKYFDDKGFHIYEEQTEKTGQTIDDWFTKANDGLTRDELIDKIEKFFEELYGDVDMDVSSAKTYLYIKFHKGPSNQSLVNVDIMDRTIEKWKDHYISNKKTGLRFTNEELKFFDDLGFDLDREWSDRVKQSMDEWF